MNCPNQNTAHDRYVQREIDAICPRCCTHCRTITPTYTHTQFDKQAQIGERSRNSSRSKNHSNSSTAQAYAHTTCFFIFTCASLACVLSSTALSLAESSLTSSAACIASAAYLSGFVRDAWSMHGRNSREKGREREREIEGEKGRERGGGDLRHFSSRVVAPSLPVPLPPFAVLPSRAILLVPLLGGTKSGLSWRLIVTYMS